MAATAPKISAIGELSPAAPAVAAVLVGEAPVAVPLVAAREVVTVALGVARVEMVALLTDMVEVALLAREDRRLEAELRTELALEAAELAADETEERDAAVPPVMVKGP